MNLIPHFLSIPVFISYDFKVFENACPFYSSHIDWQALGFSSCLASLKGAPDLFLHHSLTKIDFPKRVHRSLFLSMPQVVSPKGGRSINTTTLAEGLC